MILNLKSHTDRKHEALDSRKRTHTYCLPTVNLGSWVLTTCAPFSAACSECADWLKFFEVRPCIVTAATFPFLTEILLTFRSSRFGNNGGRGRRTLTRWRACFGVSVRDEDVEDLQDGRGPGGSPGRLGRQFILLWITGLFISFVEISSL